MYNDHVHVYDCTQVNSCTHECDPIASNCHPWIRHSECTQQCEVKENSVCDLLLLLLLSSIPKIHISVEYVILLYVYSKPPNKDLL